MLKLLVLQGLPASGKSTYAKKLCKDNPETWIRVCRDDIRNMLGTYWVPSREKLITYIEFNSVSDGLRNNYNVVLDATNLNQKHINKLIKYVKFALEFKLEIEYKEFKIPLWKCVYRDWKRGLFGGRKVGYKVIKNFYKKYYVKV